MYWMAEILFNLWQSHTFVFFLDVRASKPQPWRFCICCCYWYHIAPQNEFFPNHNYHHLQHNYFQCFDDQLINWSDGQEITIIIFFIIIIGVQVLLELGRLLTGWGWASGKLLQHLFGGVQCWYWIATFLVVNMFFTKAVKHDSGPPARERYGYGGLYIILAFNSLL